MMTPKPLTDAQCDMVELWIDLIITRLPAPNVDYFFRCILPEIGIPYELSQQWIEQYTQMRGSQA